MSLIEIRNLTFAYPGSFDNVFEGLNLRLDTSWRLGLVGRNGRGKTTLLRLLLGEYEYSGAISAPAELAYFPPRVAHPEADTRAVLEELAPGLEEWRLLRELAALEVDEGVLDRPFSTLSGGEQVKALLSVLFLREGAFPLLDEPTNHLDLHATEWLEEYLDRYKGTVLAISHDRWFLDRVVKRIIEIHDGKAEFYSGNYSFYVVEKEQRYQERLRQYEKEQAKIEQLEKAAEQLRIWAYSGNDKIFKRAQSMEKRIERIRTTDKPTRERRLDIKFGESQFRGDEVLTIKELKKSFDGRVLFDHVNLEVIGGERIALLGDNGTGKSTLLKILLGEEAPDSGKLRMGPTVKIGYLPQIIHFAHPERNLVDTMIYDQDCSTQTARNRLAAFNFRGEDVFKPGVDRGGGGEL